MKGTVQTKNTRQAGNGLKRAGKVSRKMQKEVATQELQSNKWTNAALSADKIADYAIHILGIKDTVVTTSSDWVQMVRNGFRVKAIRNLMAHTAITIDEMAIYTHTDKKILLSYDGRKKLDPVLTERTAEIANVYSKGELLMGDAATFKQWMEQPITPLGNKKPKEFLDTSFGIQMLMDELGRIEHGIYA